MLMQTTKRWFQSATMMALLAVVALFVSPALAWNCCCTSQQSVTAHSLTSGSVAQTPEKESHSCCDEEMAPAKPAANLHQTSELKADVPVCAAIKPVCECDKNAPAVFALNDHSSSFQPVPPVLVATPYTLFSPVGNTRPVFYRTVSAQPRGPDGRTRSSRGPPTSLSS